MIRIEFKSSVGPEQNENPWTGRDNARAFQRYPLDAAGPAELQAGLH
jgi:hypothetical protein